MSYTERQEELAEYIRSWCETNRLLKTGYFTSESVHGLNLLISRALELANTMRPARILNATPHDINLIEGAEYNEKRRKWCGGHVVKTIPASGTVLSARRDLQKVSSVNGIPVVKSKPLGCDPIPDDYDVVIVSAVYASEVARRGEDTRRLYTPGDTVIDTGDHARIIGCMSLIQW